MKIYHQTGFRFNWNLDTFKKGIGDGIIYSPVNIDSDKLLNLSNSLKNTSFLDPQLYLLNEAKGTLNSYPFFPGNLISDFSTIDLDRNQIQLAKLCVDYQINNGFEYIVIPTRYYENNPTNYLLQSDDYFVEPFLSYILRSELTKKVLLSVIVKSIMLTDEIKFNEILNWVTGHQKIDGIYLIFENNFSSKQIKDFKYLLNALRFIKILKKNGLEVHIGYCNTESILYSIAFPDSISIGSYENLRRFGIKRFVDSESKPMRSPNARLYSTKLLQWVDYKYIQAMQELVPEYDKYFDESIFKPLLFTPNFNWHFAKPEPYKHFFEVFTRQIEELSDNPESRINQVKDIIEFAISNFSEIENFVLLDDNSDGSHLPTWFNVINAFIRD